MNTISDLRRSLEETAHSHDVPDPGALLRGVQDDIATGRDRGNRTPRLIAAAAAVALVAGGGWALSKGLGGEETGTLQPAEQGWELVDGAPPEYAAGLALVDTVTLDAGSSEDTLTWEGGGPGFVVAWCSDPVRTALLAESSTGPSNSQGERIVACQSGPVSVPTDPEGSEITIHGFEGDIQGEQFDGVVHGEATIGLYREATIEEYPYPAAPDTPREPSPPEQARDVVIDAATPPTTEVTLDHLGEAATGYLMPAATVSSREGTTLTAWSGEPGRLLIAVNGTVITNDGEGLAQPTSPGPWQDADPDLRSGYWHTWSSAGETTRAWDLSPQALAAYGIQVSEGDTVTVAARASFTHEAWQVGIDQPEGGQSAELPQIDPTEQLPELAYGMRLVSATEVPADGATHLVDLGDVDASEVLWVPTCPQALPGTDLTIANRPTSCSSTVGWAQTVRAPEATPDEPVEVRVAAGGEPVQLGAYIPVEWDGYPFAESSTPMADDGGLGVVAAEQPAGGERLPELLHAEAREAVVYREVATVSTGDLDADGRAELTVPSSTDLGVWVASSGPARVKLEIDSVPLGDTLDGHLWPAYPLLRDGWYSAWTTGEAGTELRFDTPGIRKGQALRDNPTVTVQVEAQDGAEVELTFYEFVREADFEE